MMKAEQKLRVAGLLSTYVVDNRFGVPEYDRKVARALVTLLRKDYRKELFKVRK